MFTHNQLQDLADKVLDQFPNINYGGCCIFAAYVARELQHHYKIRIIAFSKNRDGDNIDSVRPLIKNNIPSEWRDNGCSFNHIAIEITDNKGIIWNYDACGVFPADGSISSLQQLKGSLSIEEALELANSIEWSKDFNRNDIPAIRNLILKHFYGHKKIGLGTRAKTYLASLTSQVVAC